MEQISDTFHFPLSRPEDYGSESIIWVELKRAPTDSEDIKHAIWRSPYEIHRSDR